MFGQTAVLMRKHGILALRDPIMYIGRIMLAMNTSCFFTLTYWRTRDDVQNMVLFRIVCMFWCFNVQPFANVATVFARTGEFMVARNEIRGNLYDWSSYFICVVLISSIALLFLAATHVTIPFFAILSYPGDVYLEMWTTSLALNFAYEGVANLNSLLPDPLLGMLSYVNCYFTFYVFNCIMLQQEHVVWPFKALAYVSPTGVAMQSVVYSGFRLGQFTSDTTSCTDANCTLPYICLNPDAMCFGQTGYQVLSTLQDMFPDLSPDVDVPKNILYCCLFGVYWALVYFMMGRMMCTASTTILPSTGANQNQGGASSAKQIQMPAPPVLTAQGSPEAKFTFSDISYTVMAKSQDGRKGPKHLLSHVTGAVGSSNVLALIGPSGAGKTTLLNLLTLEPGPGKAQGAVQLMGIPFTMIERKRYCSYVPQFDTLWAFLTCEEHLMYAAAMLNSANSNESGIYGLLEATGLTSAAKTKVGNALLKGLSGGQKRRLSLAIALTKGPSMIFLDEPTSGLDAASAAGITLLLRDIAKQSGAGIVCTIHQPSTTVFNRFDQVMVLTKGRVAYLGAATDCASYLAQLGQKIPPNANTADVMLDLVNADFNDAVAVDKMVETWATFQSGQASMPAGVGQLPAVTTSGTFGQTAVLMRKHGILALRDPTLHIGRCIATFQVCCYFAILYIRQRDAKQEQVQGRLFFTFFLTLVPVNFSIAAVVATNLEAQVVRNELRDAVYTWVPYVVANLLVRMPFVAQLALFCIFPSGFGIGGFPWAAFSSCFAMQFAYMSCWEGMALQMSQVPNPIVGSLMFLNNFYSLFFFSAVFHHLESVSWAFRWISHASPIGYTFRGLFSTIFLESGPFEGAEPFNITSSQNGTLAYYCPSISNPSACWGYTGTDVLLSIKKLLPEVSTDEDLNFAFLYSCGVGLFCYLGFAMGIRQLGMIGQKISNM